MFIASNSRPGINYEVHQFYIFIHLPKFYRGASLKRIIHYLKGVKDRGIIIFTRKTLKMDCHIDAEFSGLLNVEHDPYPTCVKSHTGYLILFMNYPLLCTSKLKTQIALSTMES